MAHEEEDRYGARCGASFEGSGCAYDAGHSGTPHWTITASGEVTWTEESLALHEMAMQLKRLADGVEALAEAAATGGLKGVVETGADDEPELGAEL